MMLEVPSVLLLESQGFAASRVAFFRALGNKTLTWPRTGVPTFAVVHEMRSKSGPGLVPHSVYSARTMLANLSVTLLWVPAACHSSIAFAQRPSIIMYDVSVNSCLSCDSQHRDGLCMAGPQGVMQHQCCREVQGRASSARRK
eukprot:TRINITY_DN16936_c0_g1_i1.p4 TRINITY_DN16936_c0_g1~~TRINITY_DN16936_c0_g1_i1.p4  ORF type:complete len:143 (-),score=24.39 TRINITY_DN16936_c0_g1_i1:1713-2141(-)